MDAFPRLTDMLLFVFIVRHFLCVYRLSKFCLLVESMAYLVDGTAINWSVESAPVETNYEIFFAEQSAKAIRLLNTH